MAFAINETGIERGATQLIFESAPIMLERHAEEAQDAAYAVALGGQPIVTQYARTQSKTFLRVRLRLIAGADVTTLTDLMEGAGPVDVKLTPGDATVISCIFGPRADQSLIPFNDDYATGQPDGSPVDPILTQYQAELMLLRL